jgi:GDP-mannose 6-dehydrogenase
MRIGIFGMGYVGIVSAACLLRDGHEVMGVDSNAAKARDIEQGRSPIQEPGVPEMLASGHADGRLTATTDPARAVERCEMIWICVGTPSSSDGGLDLSAVETVARQIGEALKDSSNRPLIVLRSTVLPGTTLERFIPIIEESSHLVVGTDVDVLFHPEFLREGVAVADFDEPPKIVVGEQREGAADLLMLVYEGYEAPRHRLQLGEAEMVKYSDNLFHAVKVTFANEIGAMSRACGLDGRRVAEVFCSDTKLNISPRYLRPGFAFGGSCLPKDLRAILRHSELLSVPTRMLRAVLSSNNTQVDEFVQRVLAHKPRSVGMIGLAFKKDTDDMRESPYVTVAKRLIGEGVALRIFDPGVQTDRLVGSNKEAVQKALNHLEELLVPTLDRLADCDVILVNHGIIDSTEVRKWTGRGQTVIDLAGVLGTGALPEGYEGIAW